MKLATLSYSPSTGWSGPIPKDLDSEHTLVLIFADQSYLENSAPLEQVSGLFKNAIIVGCSTAGEISGTRVSEGTISMAVIRFERTQLRLSSAPISSAEESNKVGQFLGEALKGTDLQAVLVFSDGLLVNGSELLNGLSHVLLPPIIISGGLAGDGPRFKRTWVIHNKKPHVGYVSTVGLYGKSIKLSTGSLGGWDVFGPERLVTRSSGNILYELDGKPALALYKKYLGDRASELPASALLFPLSLRSESLKRKGLVRTVLAVDEKHDSMTFAGDIPEGSYAQLMKANFNRLIEGAANAAKIAANKLPLGSVNLVIAISCVGRRLVLGSKIESETEATLEVFPPGTQQVGYYSYGEISPLASGRCDLHNQTMTLTSISEEE